MLTSTGRPGIFAVLPTVGGQTALNLAVELADNGILEKYGAQLIGAQLDAIKKGEDRLLFKDAMTKIGLEVPKSALVNNLRDGLDFSGKIGFPVILRPSFTLGGSGGGIAYNREELMELLARGLDLSPVHEVLLEESVLGWKEYELELMRDLADNVIVICSIENFDPMGVHTGDSITVAPAQTLTDREYQAHARCGHRRHPRDRRRNRRLEHPVRRESAERPHGRHRDEPARLALVGAGVEGHRLPDRQDRRQAGRRLHARRNHQRHHPQDAGLLRAHARLRRRQDSQVAVRKVPRRRRIARPADEVRRRGHGHRPHLQAGAAQGRALAGNRQAHRLGENRAAHPHQAAGHAASRAPAVHPLRARAGHDRPRDRADDQHRPLVPLPAQGNLRRAGQPAGTFARHAHRRAASRAEAHGLLRRAPGPGISPGRRQGHAGGGPPASQQTRRHARSTSASTPAPPSSRASRPTCTRPTKKKTRPRPPTARRSSSSAAGPIASGRESSSTTAAATRRSPCATTVTRPSWSTAIPRPSPPTTTPATASTSSRSPTKT